MAEVYIDSLLKLFEFFDVQLHCRVGAMWNAVPHTRPLLLTGQASGSSGEKLANLVTQRQSTYEGPTTIMGLMNEEQASRDIESISIITGGLSAEYGNAQAGVIILLQRKVQSLFMETLNIPMNSVELIIGGQTFTMLQFTREKCNGIIQIG